MILAGLVDPISINPSIAIVFVDDFSNWINAYFLKSKSDATSATARFLAGMSPYGDVKRFRCDGGGEFVGKKFQNVSVENKMKQEFSSSRSPHQNWNAERSWRGLLDMAHCF